MHLVMFLKDKQPRAGVIDGEDIVDINANDRSLPPTLKGILEMNGISRIKKIIKSRKHRAPRKRTKLLPPISNPGLLLSVGMNYHEHLKEMKTPVPEKPAAFTKSAASVKLTPLSDRVVVKATEESEQMRGGLYIPDTAKEKPQQGEIVAVGPGKYEDGKLVPMTVKVGDKVLYGKYSGTEITLDNEQFLILRESDVLAVVA